MLKLEQLLGKVFQSGRIAAIGCLTNNIVLIAPALEEGFQHPVPYEALGMGMVQDILRESEQAAGYGPDFWRPPGRRSRNSKPFSPAPSLGTP